MSRDNFSREIKLLLAKRAGFRCSAPECNQTTIGPGADLMTCSNIGEAAHIISASPDKGPRADAKATSEFRSSIQNGIWLCNKHATLIDSDVSRYSADMSLISDALAENIRMNCDELLAILDAMSNEVGVWFYRMSVRDRVIMVKKDSGDSEKPIGAFSTGEREMFIIEIFVRLSKFSARFTTTLLILDQQAFSSVQAGPICELFERLRTMDLNCQVIFALHWCPAPVTRMKEWRAWHLVEDTQAIELPEKRRLYYHPFTQRHKATAVTIVDGFPDSKKECQ